MGSYPTGVRAFTPSPAHSPYQAPVPRPSEAPWIATPLNLREDPRIIAFTAEVMALGITTSRWLAESVAIATYHRLHAWATKHEPDGTLAGVAPVVIAGAVGWEGDPGSLWASLTRAGILDTFGAITGWASTGGRRGARMSAMALPARMQMQTTTAVYAPPKHGRRLELSPIERMDRSRWLARLRSERRRSRNRGVTEPSRDFAERHASSHAIGTDYRSGVTEPRGKKDSLLIPLKIPSTEAGNRHATHTGEVSNPAVIAWMESTGITQPRVDHVRLISQQFGDAPDVGTVQRFRDLCVWWMRQINQNGQPYRGTSVEWLLESWRKGGSSATVPRVLEDYAPVAPRLASMLGAIGSVVQSRITEPATGVRITESMPRPTLPRDPARVVDRVDVWRIPPAERSAFFAARWTGRRDQECQPAD